ncbi:Signal transduction response regulator, chemotaxis, CheB-like protein [Candidatus Magnetomorum sp. HK-1]|nr:Signal transduction response regulator, chemotaxis, CheB-like protein [Candidatus Magnetomorum sp. HK-1]
MKILIVNDSKVLMTLMRAILETEPGFKVVGTASDGIEAVDQVGKLFPDLILMDIHMPRMNGVEAIRRIIKIRPKTRILITSATINRNMNLIFEGLKYGAIDYIKSPSLNATPGTRIDRKILRQAGARLLKKIQTLININKNKSSIVYQKKSIIQTIPTKNKTIEFKGSLPVLAIGCSTGGPSTLIFLLKALPRPLPGPIFICQHIDPGFDENFAKWLSTETGFRTTIPGQQSQIHSDQIYVAKAGKNMILSNNRVKYETPSPDQIYNPNIDKLFISIAENSRQNACGIILTGMGNDGARGLKEIKDKGGHILIQDNQTAIVESMPQSARKLTGVYDGYPPEILGRMAGEWIYKKAGKQGNFKIKN